MSHWAGILSDMLKPLRASSPPVSVENRSSCKLPLLALLLVVLGAVFACIEQRPPCGDDSECRHGRICLDGFCQWLGAQPNGEVTQRDGSDRDSSDRDIPGRDTPADRPTDSPEDIIDEDLQSPPPDIREEEVCCDCCGEECCECCGIIPCCGCPEPCPIECAGCPCSPDHPDGECPLGWECVGGECIWLCGNGTLDAPEECDDGNHEYEECGCSEPFCTVCGPMCEWEEVRVTFPDSVFDIEEVSTLEDAFGGLWETSEVVSHDAVVLWFDTCALPPEASWRVEVVEVLAMIPVSEFDDYPDDVRLAIEVFDGVRPDELEPFTLTQTLRIDELEWTRETLTDPATTDYLDFYAAWWAFDFTDVIVEGMDNTRITVGVWWPDTTDYPLVGYSNFNLSCERNWTVHGDGPWQHNSDVSDLCSWPMLRVEVRGINQP